MHKYQHYVGSEGGICCTGISEFRYKNKIKNYETIVTKLEAKLEVLENKVRDQDKVIASQSRELDSLRPQVEGKEELVRILADAQNLLDQTI